MKTHRTNRERQLRMNASFGSDPWELRNSLRIWNHWNKEQNNENRMDIGLVDDENLRSESKMWFPDLLAISKKTNPKNKVALLNTNRSRNG